MPWTLPVDTGGAHLLTWQQGHMPVLPTRSDEIGKHTPPNMWVEPSVNFPPRNVCETSYLRGFASASKTALHFKIKQLRFSTESGEAERTGERGKVIFNL